MLAQMRIEARGARREARGQMFAEANTYGRKHRYPLLNLMRDYSMAEPDANPRLRVRCLRVTASTLGRRWSIPCRDAAVIPLVQSMSVPITTDRERKLATGTVGLRDSVNPSETCHAWMFQ